jgi:hypothetical protein
MKLDAGHTNIPQNTDILHCHKLEHSHISQQYELHVRASYVDRHSLPAEPARPSNAVNIVFTISITTNG